MFYRMPAPGSLSYIGLSNAKMDAQFRSMQLTISHVRSLEDSPRVRIACVKYLQDWLCNFYPNRPDIVRQVTQLAEDLGGRLETPRLSWKYAWVGAMLGPHAAKRAQIVMPTFRWSMARRWDQAMFRFDHLVGRQPPVT